MKIILFELYFFALWSIAAFGAFGLDAVAITVSTIENLNDFKYSERENSEKKFRGKSMMFLDDSENDGGLTYGNEIFDGNARLLPNFYIKRSSRINVFPRACIRRNGACDNRPYDCCFSSSCRCNLWGSNCRCQRVGLFQKWG